ncbi:MAG: hypothetical protein M3416_13870 [Acidobacteriota bacterium]|nr:hypothetical protein [Acidobacteriota bacterium]
MSEETTKKFDGEESFETRVLTGLAALRDGMAVMENRFATLENRFAALENRFETLGSRFATLENRSATEFHSVDSRLASIEGRVASVELKVEALDEKVDARLRDTRPIWESVLSQLKTIDTKFDVHAHDMLELRAKMRELEKRVPPAA